ncbi:MAG: hypothetical protein ACREQ5_11325 [Candidatus Dormibacteria bacterium]
MPTRRSPVRVKATTDGVVRLPSALAMTVGSPPSITATTLFVVPRSMPTVFAIGWSLLGCESEWGSAMEALVSGYRRLPDA